jgi:hypothetical protein
MQLLVSSTVKKKSGARRLRALNANTGEEGSLDGWEERSVVGGALVKDANSKPAERDGVLLNSTEQGVEVGGRSSEVLDKGERTTPLLLLSCFHDRKHHWRALIL